MKMKDFGPGFPEWTELGQDGGLDPLGMQRPIEAIYQSLLPGISTITLRFRYYSFFVWMLEVYARDQGNTDPVSFRAFQRRCETLFALIAARGSTELGVAGIDWAQKQLNDVPNDPEAIIDFSIGADPDTDVDQRYLRNKGGAFGGIYATQMFEMGLITLGDDRNPIAVCTNRALPLAEAFAVEIGELGTAFLRCVKGGTVTLADLDRMAPMQPSEILAGSAEHRLLVQILLGQVSPAIAPDKLRRSTALMLLQLIGATKEVPRAEAVKWEWFGAGHHAAAPVPATEDVRNLWALYQACDLMRLAYENILDLALDFLQEAELRRMPLGRVVTELVGLVDVPGGTTWRGYSASLLEGLDPSKAAKLAEERMVEARASGDRATRMQSVVALVSALVERTAAFGELLDSALNAPDHFQSLRTEVKYLQAPEQENARTVLDALVRERVLKRHLWVASRKFRNQKAYTFLIEPEEGLLRYRDRFRVSPSSPRLDQAMRFLRDVKLIDNAGLTDFGRAELDAA
ncbi:hypothetical protein [Maritimibacter alkaliphilus]|uniref:hypothetical protein n=1 Tax=Maritimibacter alkaliphilus TaxID=404236 RepID=UPI001C938C91|nr:hypothetical protein [Maritimibacter alkaliphilus]MBY6090917.1 hypothetical protein [Maritimibacter alkaliphilus]